MPWVWKAWPTCQHLRGDPTNGRYGQREDRAEWVCSPSELPITRCGSAGDTVDLLKGTPRRVLDHPQESWGSGPVVSEVGQDRARLGNLHH
jgi:hypothetical protein